MRIARTFMWGSLRLCGRLTSRRTSPEGALGVRGVLPGGRSAAARFPGEGAQESRRRRLADAGAQRRGVEALGAQVPGAGIDQVAEGLRAQLRVELDGRYRVGKAQGLGGALLVRGEKRGAGRNRIDRVGMGRLHLG